MATVGVVRILAVACWTLVVLAPLLRMVNGPAVSADQLVARTLVVVVALAGAISFLLLQTTHKKKPKKSRGAEKNRVR